MILNSDESRGLHLDRVEVAGSSPVGIIGSRTRKKPFGTRVSLKSIISLEMMLFLFKEIWVGIWVGIFNTKKHPHMRVLLCCKIKKELVID